MPDPKAIDGVQSLLFEKLVDLDPKSSNDPQVFRVMGLEDLKSSIRRELERIIDTRRPLTVDQTFDDDRDRGGEPRTVMEYGIPDWSTVAPLDVRGRNDFARAVCDAIKAFEPRLLNPRITIAARQARHKRLTLLITGEVRLGDMVEPVSFPIDFSSDANTQHSGA